MPEEKHQDTHHSNRNLVVLLSLSIFVVISLLTFLLIKSSEENKQITKTKAYEEAQTKPNPTIRERNVPEEGPTLPLQEIKIIDPPEHYLGNTQTVDFHWYSCQLDSQYYKDVNYDLNFVNKETKKVIIKYNVGHEAIPMGKNKTMVAYNMDWSLLPEIDFKQPNWWEWHITCSAVSLETNEKMLLGISKTRDIHLLESYVKLISPQNGAKFDLTKEVIPIEFAYYFGKGTPKFYVTMTLPISQWADGHGFITRTFSAYIEIPNTALINLGIDAQGFTHHRYDLKWEVIYNDAIRWFINRPDVPTTDPNLDLRSFPTDLGVVGIFSNEQYLHSSDASIIITNSPFQPRPSSTPWPTNTP